MSSYDTKLSKYYDCLYQEKDYDYESKLIVKHANCYDELLDVGCGTLSHSIILSKSFKKVTAVDLSASMIDTGNQKLLDLGIKNVKALNCDLADLQSAQTFNTAISMFNVVNHLQTIEDLKIFFQLISKSLKDGGTFVFDCWNGIACIREIPHEISNKEVKSGNLTLTAETKTVTDLMKSESVMTTTVKAFNSGVEIDSFSYNLTQKLWVPSILIDVLKSTGISITKIIPFFDDSRWANHDDYRLTFICRKTH